jgi:hypothetical protein
MSVFGAIFAGTTLDQWLALLVFFAILAIGVQTLSRPRHH